MTHLYDLAGPKSTPPIVVLADFVQWMLHSCVLSPAVCSPASVPRLLQLAYSEATATTELGADGSASADRATVVQQAAAGLLWAIAGVSAASPALNPTIPLCKVIVNAVQVVASIFPQ